MVIVVALVQLVAGGALIGSLNGVALGLNLLDLLFAGNGTQLGQNHIGLDLPVGDKAALLQETVGKALDLRIRVRKVSGTQGHSLKLGDSLLFDTSLGTGLDFSLLGGGEFLQAKIILIRIYLIF